MAGLSSRTHFIGSPVGPTSGFTPKHWLLKNRYTSMSDTEIFRQPPACFRRCEHRHDVLRPIRHIHQELRYVRELVYKRPLFLSLGGEAPDPLIEPFGNVEIAVRADRKAGRGLELPVDYHARLELAARGHSGDVVGEDAAGPRGADVQRLAVQNEVHGLRELLPLDVRHESPRLYLEDLEDVPRLVGHVE